MGQCGVRLPFFHDLDQNCARGKAEHCERNSHESEVVPHRDAEDARQKQLELQQ
jgi:hypothetical protein